MLAKFLGRLKTAYKSILERVGDPLEDGVLYGPLHNQQAVDAYKVCKERSSSNIFQAKY